VVGDFFCLFCFAIVFEFNLSFLLGMPTGGDTFFGIAKKSTQKCIFLIGD